MSDFTSDRPWRVDPMYVDYARDGGIFPEIGERLAGGYVAGAVEDAVSGCPWRPRPKMRTPNIADSVHGGWVVGRSTPRVVGPRRPGHGGGSRYDVRSVV